MQLSGYMVRAMATARRVAADFFRDCLLVEPLGFVRATGERVAVESSSSVHAFIGRASFGAVPFSVGQPGDEKVLVVASEVGSLVPAAGHYLVETLSGQRHDIVFARLDGTGVVWELVCVRNANEDLGDLSVATSDEDLGDLAVATLYSDCGGLL